VDLGAWASLVLGIDGGAGSPELCQPLAERPGVFGGEAAGGGGARPIRVAVAVLVPDEDVSRVHAEVHARDAQGRELPAQAEALVSDTVSSLAEAFRSLGGEASTAAAELEVTCTVGG
jgi:hypothetical protein